MKALAMLGVSVLSVVALAGNRCVWTGLGGDGKWSTAANWQDAGGTGDVPSSGNGDAIVLTGGANTTQDIADGFSLDQLVFSNTTAAVTLGGKSLSFTTANKGYAIAAIGSKGFTVSNDIAFANSVVLKAASDVYSCSGDVVFRGVIDAGANTIYHDFTSMNNGLHFYGPVTAAVVSMNSTVHRKTYFHRAQHAVGKLVRWYGTAYYFPEPEAFAGPVKPVMGFNSSYAEGTGARYDLVNDQTFDRIDGTRSSSYPHSQNIFHYSMTPTDYVTLTLKATDNASTFARICGELNNNSPYEVRSSGLIHLVYDPQGDYTQTFKDRDHFFSGAIVVKGGTLESAGSNTFSTVSRLDVRNGATLKVNSSRARSFAGVHRAILAGNAKVVVCAESAEELFGEAPATVLEMGDAAQLDFAADVTVAQCFTNGVALAADTYDAARLPQLKGVGRLVVTSVPEERPALLPSLSADGQGYVDIGLEGTSGLMAEMDMSWQATSGTTCFLGARKSSSSRIQLLDEAEGSSKGAAINYGDAVVYDSTHAHFALNQRYRVVTVLTNGCQTMRTYAWDGEKFSDEPDADLKIDATRTGDVKTGYNLHVFSANSADSAASSYRSKSTCYGVRIWRRIAGEWVLVRDLKPAARNFACGLWDEVDKVFYPASGTVFSAVATWTGAGDGRRIGDSANWSDGCVPYGGRVKFDLSAAPQTVENDLEGIRFYDLEATGTQKLSLTGHEIVLTAGKNAFSNNCPLYVSTPLTFTSDAAEMWIGDSKHDVVVDGALKATAEGTFTVGRPGCSYHVYFNGPISNPNGRINLPLQGNGCGSLAYMSAKITCHELWLPGRSGITNGKSDAARCGIYLSGANDVDLVYGHGKSSWMFGGGNTFSEKTVWVAHLAGSYSGWGSDAYSHQLSDGTVETLNRLSGTYVHDKQMQIFSKNGGEAILHLKGTQSDSTTFWLRPTVSVIWDPKGAFTQTFMDRAHDTTGFIEVRGGTVESAGSNSFPALSRLIVRSGATFKVADTCPAVFGETPTVNLVLESGATLDVPADSTLKVGSLVVDGVPVEAGEHTTIEGVTFTGAKIDVAGLPTFTEWTGSAADGKFATAGNWTTGMPSATCDGRVTKSGTYAVAVEGATTLGGLVVAAEEGTATVRAAADVTVGGVLALGSPLSGEGGVYEQTAGRLTASATAAKIVLHEDGTLRLHGGNAIVKNVLSMMGGTLELQGASQLDYQPSGSSSQRYFATGTVRLEGTSVVNAFVNDKSCEYLTPDYAGGELLFEVADQAFLNFGGDSSLFNESTYSGVCGSGTKLKVSGSGRVSFGHSAAFGSGKGTYGELVLEDNAYVYNTYWLVHIGGSAGTDATQPARGVAYISGGCLYCAGNESSSGQCLGIGVGTRKANTGEAANVGELYLSGGVVSNAVRSVFAVGYGDASGRVVQTGGAIVSRPNSRAESHNLIGFRGGEGYYEMSGGTFDSNRSVFVGGCTAADIGRTFTSALANDLLAKGTLKLLGGTFATEQNLVVAKCGEGTLVLGKDADLRVGGNLEACAGAKLVVDVTGWDGARSRTLAAFGGTTTAFADENVELVGELPANTQLSITATRIRLKGNSGVMLLVR